MEKAAIVYLLIYIVTFGALLPFLCSSLVFSTYYMESLAEDIDKTLLAANDRRRQEARRYLQAVDVNRSRAWHMQQLSNGGLDVLITVVTVDRSSFNNNPRFYHLTQTVTKLDREIRESHSGLRTGLLVCNADPYPSRYEEAVTLSTYYPTVHRVGNVPSPSVDVREIEKRDYVFCVRAALNSTVAPRYVLVVEDDAEPYPGMLATLARVLLRKSFLGDSTLFLKLYYPERWSGFGWDPMHLMELIASGFSTASLALLVLLTYRWCTRVRSRSSSWALRLHWVIAFVYGVLLALAVGRQHLIQLRRLAPYLVTVRAAPDCCTPAVLFPTGVLDRVTQFLDGTNCSTTFGLDLALDLFATENSFHRFLVEPNLFHHRGYYSTLTKPKQRDGFLFDI